MNNKIWNHKEFLFYSIFYILLTKVSFLDEDQFYSIKGNYSQRSRINIHSKKLPPWITMKKPREIFRMKSLSLESPTELGYKFPSRYFFFLLLLQEKIELIRGGFNYRLRVNCERFSLSRVDALVNWVVEFINIARGELKKSVNACLSRQKIDFRRRSRGK